MNNQFLWESIVFAKSIHEVSEAAKLLLGNYGNIPNKQYEAMVQALNRKALAVK